VDAGTEREDHNLLQSVITRGVPCLLCHHAYWSRSGPWFHALLNEHRGGEPPQFHPDHPLRCHRRRVPDRVVFGHVIDTLVHGSGYERIATAGCSDASSAAVWGSG